MGELCGLGSDKLQQLSKMTFKLMVNGFGKSIIYLIKGHSGKIPISDIHYWANKIGEQSDPEV